MEKSSLGMVKSRCLRRGNHGTDPSGDRQEACKVWKVRSSAQVGVMEDYGFNARRGIPIGEEPELPYRS